MNAADVEFLAELEAFQAEQERMQVRLVASIEESARAYEAFAIAMAEAFRR